MIGTDFSTDSLPAEERFDIWRDQVAAAPAPMDATSDQLARFHVYQRDVHLDAARVWKMRPCALAVHRTPRLIRHSDPEAYNVCLVQSGSLERRWDAREAVYGPHDIHVNDSSRPFDLQAPGDRGIATSVGVEVPKELVPLPRWRADRVPGIRMSGREGIGAILGAFLTQLTGRPESYSASDGPRLALALGDLVSALFAHSLDAEGALAPESRTRVLWLRIRAFIHENLHEPHLTPGAIAAAHHISVGYLHRLFKKEGVTVGGWIRQQRLERTRRDLADLTLSAVPIHHIAARWGFRHPAAFSRAFRATYGIAPRDYRSQFLRAEAA